ncbi:MAG: sodium:alanine symporter family protein [Alphaproteobacteria bacterium]|nr:sodium:alanine symporter family protein [Alphaproteobacteria bacterium]
MEILSSWLWNPFLVFMYIQLGLLFAFATRGAAFKGMIKELKALWRERHAKTELAHERAVSHRHAFFAALSATVGVGNLAGVGTAIHLGGPGALFWMWVSALLGMSFRMSSAYWAVKQGHGEEKSKLFATPMLYIVKNVKSHGTSIAAVLAVLLMMQGLVSANLIQANSVAQAISGETGLSNFWTALALGTTVALVVIGGFRTILNFSSLVAPWMIIAYVLGGWSILLFSEADTWGAFSAVIFYAFNPLSIGGGLAGYAVMEALQFGIARGVFSHGSGIGLTPFWQGANHDHPSRAAFMAAAVPFVDTIIVCTTTGLVILTADQWLDKTGAYLTVSSFTHFLGEGGRIMVTACLVVFAYTTIISWAHFAERCYEYLGGKNVMHFRYFFSAVAFVGPFLPLAPLWSFGDLLIGTMLMVHLLPLTYIVLKNIPTMRRDLLPEETEDPDEDDDELSGARF